MSVFSSNTLGKDLKKEGQPDPLSYFVLESNSFVPHPTQWYEPSLYSELSELLPGGAVPSCFKI